MDWFVLIAWSAFFPIPIYWIPVHAAIGFWRRLGGRTYWFALVVWVLVAWVFLGHRGFWFHGRFPRNLWTYAAGSALLAMELAITRRVGALLGGSWRLLGAALASVPLYYLMTALEERDLRARFGDEFVAYRRRVPRFLPRLRRVK